jgi:uncharacterized protein
MTAHLTVAAARALYEQTGGAHDFDHVLRVTALAERIAAAEGADGEIVRTAALLHDAGEAADRERHHLVGAQMARDLLRDHPRPFVEAVAHAIEAHRYRAEPAPQTLEARVLSDADKLDAIGAIGVARAFAHAGSRGTALWRKPWREIEAEAAGAQLGAAQLAPGRMGPEYTPLHEFVYKLDRIPERLYTESARRIAAGRLQVMRAYFDRLDAEVAGEE